jgi:TrmH RNA methyltransferase
MEKRAGAREPHASERVVGLSAVRAVLEVRAADVLNIAHSPEARLELADVLRSAAKRRIAYREVPREELDRIAGTLHHEGVCMLARPRGRWSLEDVVADLAEGGFVVALDRVDNPHNVGAVLRSAAFFGARALLVAAKGPEVSLTPAAVRIAEGGAEHVSTVFVTELAASLARLRREGAHIVGADAHASEPGRAVRFPDKTVLVLGSERHGLSADTRTVCHRLVRIAGSGAVESLNVSVAAGVLMAKLCADWEQE